MLDKNRESGDGDETREKRKNEKREIEADEGVGEEAVEKKEGFTQMGHCAGFHSIPNESVGAEQATGKASVEEVKEKVQRNVSFKMKHHLTKHLKTHGGLRPYECGLCGKKVIWRDSFLRHQARCERLASSSSANSNNTSTPAADVDDGYSYGFEDGEAFLASGGQVKVEAADFHGEVEHGMDGLLGGVSGLVDQLRTQSQNLDSGSSHVFKEEASESFSGS
ncbi:Zinc finger and BTB domain-containing protein 22 [Nibea albiflora]|uniref:Zinc finger and BTB domain-containing protein 22 n=1 Tax=Nibea albiflora TaxID=240163 RepID=A0ACB7ESV9_NIBAL|nr:Zinc finger and BTB domain-containing protein 22 [Nibea albiflora]